MIEIPDGFKSLVLDNGIDLIWRGSLKPIIPIRLPAQSRINLGKIAALLSNDILELFI